MNKIKAVKLDSTNWLELTIINELDKEIHCESFGDSDEYQGLLAQRCVEFGVELSSDNLAVVDEQKANRHVPTQEEIEANQAKLALDLESSEKLKAYEERKALMLVGKDYNGYQISFTKDDGDGVVQVDIAFRRGLASTVIHFDCGTNMPIQANEFNDFALWFMVERNKFFKVE